MPDTATPTEAATEITALRGRAMELATDIAGVRASMKDKTSDELKAIREDSRAKTDELYLVDAEIRAREAAIVPQGRGPLAATGQFGDMVRTAGEAVVNSEEYRAYTKTGTGHADVEIDSLALERSRMTPQYSRAVRAMDPEFRASTITTSPSDTPAGGLFAPVVQPSAPIPRRQRLFLNDLVPTTELNVLAIPYIQEKTPLELEDQAVPIAETAAKTQVDMKFQEVTANMRTIPAWVAATRQLLRVAPVVRDYIDGRLAYMVQLALEKQCLNGDGTGQNVLGIRHQVGLQSEPGIAGDHAVSLANGIAKVNNVDLDVDGIVMNGLDYWAMVTRRHTGGDESFDQGSPFSSLPNLVWSSPIVRTRAMEQGKALVGAFALGAHLFYNEQLNIRVGEQHSDYFTKNLVAILAELMATIAVYRPDGFCEVTLAAA